MVEFVRDYWHALQEKPIETIDLSPKEVGIAMGIGDPWVNVKTAVAAGASHVELGFTGVGKGFIGQQQTTPEMIGKEKREDIRHFAKINDVTLSTHATIGITGLSGLTRDQRAFSDSQAEQSLIEVKRAVDFAADIGGGPVVIHSGEFPREIGEEYKKEHFESYSLPSGEKIPREEVVSLVDKNTGEIIRFMKGYKVLEPVWAKNEKGEWIDMNGKPIEDPLDLPTKGVPVVDKDGRIKFEEKDYAEFERRAKIWNERHPENPRTAGQMFFFALKETEAERAQPWAHEYYRNYLETQKNIEKLRKMEENYRNLEKSPGVDIENLRYIFTKSTSIELPKDKLPSEVLSEEIKRHQAAAERFRDGFIGYSKQVEEFQKLKERIVPIEEVGKKRSAEKFADAAMYAYEMEKKKKTEKPIVIAPENVFPEWGWGSHPQELKELVLSAREAMVKKLMAQKKMSEEEAKRVAEQHIKATFDIGHANTWKKFFRGTEEEFKKWLNKQVDELIKAGVIGHVHLSDNFGYYDEHLAPGQGNTPIEDFVKKLKAGGFKEKMVVEPGAQGEGESIYSAMISTWAKIAGSPMYRAGPISRAWTDVQGSYFGRTWSAPYIAGGYLVDPKAEENWWSGVPIE